MSTLSDKHCEVCLQKGIRKKIRTLFDEGRELLCEECSEAQLHSKALKNHISTDLDPPREESRSAGEGKLEFDFLEYAKIAETTLHFESGSNISQEKETKEGMGAKSKQEKVDFSKIKPTRITKFSVKRFDDMKTAIVTGILCLTDKVIIVDYFNKKLKQYDTSGNYLSSNDLKEYTWGIARVNHDKFAICGPNDNKLFLWNIRGQSIISEDEVYDVNYKLNGIHYNDTYYCVLHRLVNAVTILDRQGRQVRKIVMEEAFGKKITFGFDIHMDRDTHDIYVPCCSPSGILCMSVEGEAIWFTPLSDAILRRITEIHGTLCVADHANGLHMISKTGQYIRKVLDKEELDGEPHYIHYDDHQQKLCISYRLSDIVSVYSV